jgi:hypothetical protein
VSFAPSKRQGRPCLILQDYSVAVGWLAGRRWIDVVDIVPTSAIWPGRDVQIGRQVGFVEMSDEAIRHARMSETEILRNA